MGKEEGGEGGARWVGYITKSLQFYALDVDLYKKKKLSGTYSSYPKEYHTLLF